MEGQILGRMRRYLSTASWCFVSYLINESSRISLDIPLGAHRWGFGVGRGWRGETRAHAFQFERVRITSSRFNRFIQGFITLFITCVQDLDIDKVLYLIRKNYKSLREIRVSFVQSALYNVKDGSYQNAASLLRWGNVSTDSQSSPKHENGSCRL